MSSTFPGVHSSERTRKRNQQGPGTTRDFAFNLAWFAGGLSRPKLPIPRIPQARHDIADVVEMAINGANMDGHVREVRLQLVEAFGGRSQRDGVDEVHD